MLLILSNTPISKHYCLCLNPCLDIPTKSKFYVKNLVKFMFSKKATKIDEIFTIDLTLCSKCQIDGEDFKDSCGLLRKHEL